jgi:nucleoside-diphosphate-sugar epimerase
MPVFGDGSQTRSFSYIDVVAEAIAHAPEVPAAKNATINIGGDESVSVRDIARSVAAVMEVPHSVEFLAARDEVHHAHCDHSLARAVFAEAYRRHEVSVAEGLRRMAEYVRARGVPPMTECPSAIELPDKLPPSWATNRAERD